MNEEIVQSTWECPSCKAINTGQNSFCKNCGFNPAAKTEVKKNWTLVIVVVVVAVAILGGASYFGFTAYKKSQEEKKTKAYLQSQQTVFGDAIKSINGLGTEIDFSKKYKDEKNLDLVVQKMGDEKYKTSQTADVVSKAKDAQVGVESTPATDGLKFLMTSFYADAAALTGKYDKFMVFQYDDAKVAADSDKDMQKFKQQFTGDFKSDEEVIAYFQALAGVIDRMVASYDSLNVPEGMQDYKKPIESLKEFSVKLNEFTDAIKKKDFKKADALATEIKTFADVIATSAQKANEISDNYYSQLHDEFVSLRSKADKIKSEIVLLDAKMQIQPLDFSVEGW